MTLHLGLEACALSKHETVRSGPSLRKKNVEGRLYTDTHHMGRKPPPKPKLKSDVLGQFQTLNGSATYIRFGEEDIILKVEDSI